MPRVTKPAREPGNRHRRARDRSADHRGLRPDREHVRTDRGKRAEVTPGPADPEHDGEREHPAREQHDVLARDRQQVIEARAPKRLFGLVGQPSVVAEQTPSTSARRSPVSPGEDERRSHRRSRSATPPRPPRFPTTCHSSTWRTTCTPCRRSQVRSSKPRFGPRGALTTARRLRRAPCGGARPSGSSSSTRSPPCAPSDGDRTRRRAPRRS